MTIMFGRKCRGQIRWSRGILACLLLVIPSLVRSQTSDLGGFMDYEDCYEQLYLADTNADMQLTTAEYVDFIEIRSNGRITVDNYEDFSLPFITNYVFAACMCSFYGDGQNCCVGPDATIDLDPNTSPLVNDSIFTFCYHVDLSIAGSLEPTPNPSTAPTTLSPTSKPSKVPTKNPTASPTETLTNQPSSSPTNTPTKAPTELPTDRPSKPPTTAPVAATTDSPTYLPTGETPMPTPEALACVDFQYGIVNSDGYDADDIFNEVGNTLKTGLLIATRNITIEVLNETYPRDDSQRFLRRRMKRKTQRNILVDNEEDHGNELQYDEFGKLLFRHIIVPLKDSEHSLFDSFIKAEQREDLRERRRAAFVSSGGGYSEPNVRRLVFYSDDFPVLITDIVENPFCQENEYCSIVLSTSCVLLEEGDVREEVEAALLNGIRAAILNGDFEAAIPPEHQLPGDQRVMP